ncbi:MAG: DUF2786 domain-containing protein [Planctomycetota bacterium]
MEFVWNDGGRAAAGFVGTTNDCVVRALSIATGIAYRTVYEHFQQAARQSPRKGMPVELVSRFLEEREWTRVTAAGESLQLVDRECGLPKGVVVAHVSRSSERCQHLTTLVDRVVHDTWNPIDDDYLLQCYWTPPKSFNSDKSNVDTHSLAHGSKTASSSLESKASQKEFERVLRVLRALDKTASNQGSTEAEKRNALRAMQQLMLSNNLTREDLQEKNTDLVQFTRMTCLVNGSRACQWEKDLAAYLCDEVVSTVQWYVARRGHRTVFSFYGPRAEVRIAIELFRELLLSIATSAKLLYGGYSRGSGASYAEGYVTGLPRQASPEEDRFAGNATTLHSDAGADKTKSLRIAHERSLILHRAAKDWLRRECHIRLVNSTSSGRSKHDPAAGRRGKQHGSQHSITRPDAQKRLL